MAELMIYKSIPFAVAEVKTVLKKREWEGYASTFHNTDSYGDIIEPGAFKKTVAERGPKASNQIKGLWEHAYPFGVIEELSEDSHGLWLKGRASQTRENEDRLQYMADGVVDSMSIGFSIPEGKSWWEDDGGWYGIRHIEEVKLYEVSVVMFPANELAAISGVRKSVELNNLLKSMSPDDLLAELKEFEGIDVRAVDRALEVLSDVKSLKETGRVERKALGRQQEPAEPATPPVDPEPPAGEDEDEILAKNAREYLQSQIGMRTVQERLSSVFG